jgi:hypothetical protein
MDWPRQPANHGATSNPKELSMAIFSSPRFLRNVLLADALSCISCGALQVIFPDAMASLFKLPAPLLLATGWFLLAYAAVVAWIALRTPVPRGLVWLLVAGNAGWAVGCVALLASGAVAPSALGTAWVLAQAVTVALLAELQWTGLRRPAPDASWA